MGLDMYLERQTYIFEYPEGNRPEITHHGVTFKNVNRITEAVGYWRKANAIHKWFVDHVQDGVDECQDSYVSREQLIELLATVDTVLESLYPNADGEAVFDKAAELLPPEEGFFFGSTEFDEGYIDDLYDTKKILTDALALPEITMKDHEMSSMFIYHASW